MLAQVRTQKAGTASHQDAFSGKRHLAASAEGPTPQVAKQSPRADATRRPPCKPPASQSTLPPASPGGPGMTSEDQALRPIETIGFIGLGVMGEPMCGHLARRAGRPVLAHDLRPEPAARLAAHGVTAARPADIAGRCELILLSLPDGKAVA